MRINKCTIVTNPEKAIESCKAQMQCFGEDTVYHQTAKQRLRLIENRIEYKGNNIPNERPEL